MEMIASIKMQKAVRTAESTREYIQNAWNVLDKLAGLVLPKDHPLVHERPVTKTAVIFVTSDRGLCGSYNAEVIKKLIEFNGKSASSVDIIAIGKVGAAFAQKHQLGNLVAEFPSFENNIEITEVIPISKMTIDEFLANKYDQVIAIYSHFESSLRQTPVVRQILPLTDEHIDKPELWTKKQDSDTPFKFEPSAKDILDAILKQVLEAQIFGAILEANASEHSARMVAMKSATDNASDLISELQLVYNTIRQNSITSEIAEISGAAESMK